MKGCNRFTRIGGIAAVVMLTGGASYVAFAARAVAAPAGTFQMCPTQQQLISRGATKAEVTSAPPQVSTGTFPITATVSVPDEQCRYQGSWLLGIIYWHMSRAQEAAAANHFKYECKGKSCTVFVSSGVNVEATTTGGKTKTKSVPTLNEVILGGGVTGEVSAIRFATDAAPCEVFADVLYHVF
ncbi:MAG TPA: hypothetical protein VGN06_10710, partial [Gaiellaceae bacterium]